MKTTPLVIVPNQGNHGETICIQTEQGKVIAEILVHYEHEESEAMSYAKLFHAAPDLLEALIRCHKNLSFLRDSIEGSERLELDESLDQILIAIKKAQP